MRVQLPSKSPMAKRVVVIENPPKMWFPFSSKDITKSRREKREAFLQVIKEYWDTVHGTKKVRS